MEGVKFLTEKKKTHFYIALATKFIQFFNEPKKEITISMLMLQCCMLREIPRLNPMHCLLILLMNNLFRRV